MIVRVGQATEVERKSPCDVHIPGGAAASKMKAPCWALSSTCRPHGQQLGKLRHNIGTDTQSTYTSHKIRSNIKPGKKETYCESTMHCTV